MLERLDGMHLKSLGQMGEKAATNEVIHELVITVEDQNDNG